VDAKRGHVVGPLRAAAGSRRRRGAQPGAAAAAGDIRFHIDADGRQHFNFEQRIWLDPLVPMACTRVPSTALTTLAVNLLTLVMRARDYRAAIGVGSRQAVLLAQDFSDECLLPAPGQAWVMPRAAIRAWIESHRRSRGAGRAR
jgi:hypothetical protein